MSHPKYLLFDVDGVLIHAEPWSLRVAREYGINNDMKLFFRGIFQKCLIGKADLKEILPPYLNEWGWNEGVESYLKNWFDSENLPDEELISMVQKIRKTGIKCYVATNQEKYRLEYIQKNMHFDTLFDGVFCSAKIGFKKPQREYYLHIIQRLDISPNEIFYFDDSLENIEVAHSLGINAFIYKDKTDFTKAISICT